jgi:chaperonin GroEL
MTGWCVQVGVKIVKKACQEPCFLIAQNAGFEGAVIVQKVLAGDGNMGFNAYEGEMVDMMHAGIIDPVKVVRIGLQDASSVATMLTTTEAMIVQVSKQLVGWARALSVLRAHSAR